MGKTCSLVLAGLVSSIATPVMAQAIRTSVDVSASADVASNPFLLANGESAASGTIRITPLAVLESERGETTFRGNFRYSHYTDRYGGDEAAQFGVNANRAVDERTQVTFGANVATSRSALRDDLAFGIGSLLQENGIDDFEVAYLDPTIIGTRTRRTTFGANAGLEHALDPTSVIGISATFDATNFHDVGFDYQRYAGLVGYSRRVTERTLVRVSAQVEQVDYQDRGDGNSTVFSPHLEVEQQLTQTLSLAVSGGASFISTQRLGADSKRTVFSGRMRLCDRGTGRAFCLDASRSALPTALGTISKVTSVGANVDFQLPHDQGLSFAARYSRTGDAGLAPLAPLLGGRELLGFETRYNKRLTERLSLFVSAGVVDLSDAQADRDSNLTASIGLTMKFGNR